MALTGRTDQRSLGIARRLAQRHAGDADNGAVTEATLGIWREMTGHLAPMIGIRGINAIFGRSLHLTALAFPWLAAAGELEEGGGSLASFLASLKARDPAEAAEASLALLATFTDLLAAMIGASLTDRLLSSIWAPPASASTEETAS